MTLPLSPRLLLACGLVPTLLAAEQEPPPMDDDGGPVIADAGLFIPVHALGDVTFAESDRWVAAASRKPQPIALAPAAVTVLDSEELVFSPALTIPDRLRYESGIDVAAARHGQYEVGLRGYGSLNHPRTLALYDGRPLRFEQIGAQHWIAAIHPSDLDRVEVVKGPASVTYGANAFGGVIAVEPRPAPATRQVTTFIQLGSEGLYDGDITVAAPFEEIAWAERIWFKARAGFSHRGDLPGPTGHEPGPAHPRIDSTGEDSLEALRTSGVIGIDWQDGWGLELEAGYTELEPWDLLTDYIAGVYSVRSDTLHGSATLHLPWGELRHIHNESDVFFSNQKYTYDPSAHADFWYFQAAFDDVWDQTRLQFDLDLGQHALSFGGEYERFESTSNLWNADGIAADPATHDTITTENVAVFAEDQWLIDERWALTLGLRVDDHSVVDVNVSPRLAVNYQKGPDEFWRLGFSSGYRLPNSLELHIDTRFFTSADGIEAETVNAVDLGWQRILPEQDLEWQANAFYSIADDLLFFQPIPADEMEANWDAWMNERLMEIGSGQAPDLSSGPSHFFEFVNLDNPQHTYGLELDLEWQPPLAEDWTVWTNLTWTRSRYEDDLIMQSDGFFASGPPPLGGQQVRFRFDENLGDDINAPPEWKANLGTRWRHAGWFLGAVARYVDERRVFSIAYSNWDTDQVRTQTLDDYLAIDLSLGLSWGPVADPDGYLRFSALNVFDADGHAEVHSPASSILMAADDTSYAASIGRQFGFTGSIRF